LRCLLAFIAGGGWFVARPRCRDWRGVCGTSANAAVFLMHQIFHEKF
jgi:hypothetical protein